MQPASETLVARRPGRLSRIIEPARKNLPDRAWAGVLVVLGATVFVIATVIVYALWKLSAVVLKWSHARKRYERQGLLVDEAGLATAESECLADADARERRGEREARRRSELDQAYVGEFARRVRELFPGCPPGRERAIAEHACLKYTGRVGRSAAAKTYDEDAVRLAVLAHVRHTETSYDELLASGLDRREARRQVEDQVRSILTTWQQP